MWSHFYHPPWFSWKQQKFELNYLCFKQRFYLVELLTTWFLELPIPNYNHFNPSDCLEFVIRDCEFVASYWYYNVLGMSSGDLLIWRNFEFWSTNICYCLLLAEKKRVWLVNIFLLIKFAKSPTVSNLWKEQHSKFMSHNSNLHTNEWQKQFGDFFNILINSSLFLFDEL